MPPDFLHHETTTVQEEPDQDQCSYEQVNNVKESLKTTSQQDSDHSVDAVPTDPPHLPVEIAFSASGGAFVYQAGVAAYLQEHFDLSGCHISGCSGGAWAAANLAAGISCRESFQVIKRKRAEMVHGKTHWWSGYGGTYAKIVSAVVHEVWNKDATALQRMKEHGLTIAVTRFPSFQPERHTSWTSVDDLTKSILASCMIPFAVSGKPCISLRGKWYVDGGFTNFKGINCDLYSTCADFLYHSAQVMVKATRRMNLRLAQWFFPSLVQPFAKLLNNILPSPACPHGAIEPLNPQNSTKYLLNEATQSENRPRFVLTPWSWRSTSLASFHLTLDMDVHEANFQHGYEDARLHHDEIAAVLPPLALSSSP